MAYFTTVVLEAMLKNAKTQKEKMMIITFIQKKILESK